MNDFWQFLTDSSNWSGRRGIIHRSHETLEISIAATLFAAMLSIPPAVVLAHIRRGGSAAVTFVNLGRALPSFGIMLLAVPISIRWGYGIGYWPAFVALLFLAVPPIFTNTYTGVREVDRDIVEAARGMGMSSREVVFKVEIPNALPLILTGLRVTSVQVIATASLAAIAGYESLGSYLYEGFQSGDETKLYTGAVFIGVLAIGTDLIFSAIERAATPWLRRRRPSRVKAARIPNRRIPA